MTRNRIRTAIYVALAVLFKINDPVRGVPAFVRLRRGKRVFLGSSAAGNEKLTRATAGWN
jgi:hypothetical protein